MTYDAGVDLVKPNLGSRRRTSVTLTDSQGNSYQLYLKRYGPTALSQKARALLTHGRWMESAALEQANIAAVSSAGVSTMDALAWEQRSGSSYILVSGVPGDALERCGEKFMADCKDRPVMLELLTSKLADLAGRLHRASLVHRDLYASHIFLDVSADDIKLNLIDLARVFKPRHRMKRWRVKDLAQLKYSMPQIWLKDYWNSFIRQYCLTFDDDQWTDLAICELQGAIDRKVITMTRHDRNKRSRLYMDNPK